MTLQPSLFDLSNLASTIQIPAAPALHPHQWPFPGMTPEDSARAGIAIGEEYADMLAAVIQSKGGAKLISKEILTLIPADWIRLCGDYAHGSISWTQGEQRGIKTDYVSHDCGGYHFTYQAIDSNSPLQRKPE